MSSVSEVRKHTAKTQRELETGSYTIIRLIKSANLVSRGQRRFGLEESGEGYTTYCTTRVSRLGGYEPRTG